MHLASTPVKITISHKNTYFSRMQLPQPELEFHVSRKAREKYGFDETLFTIRGNVIFANFYAAQLFAQQINEKRPADKAASAAELNAMGLIHEILHNLIDMYRQTRNANVFREALENLEQQFTRKEIDKTLEIFVEEFPPIDVHRKKITVKKYLQGATDGRENRQIALEEMMLLWLSNQNPAFAKYQELFDDTPLREATVYPKAMNSLNTFFDAQPLFGPAGKGMNLLQALLQPAKANPGSLIDQLNFLRETWGTQLSTLINIKWEMLLGEAFTELWGVPGADYGTRMLRAADFMEEETKMRFFPGPGKAETHTPEYVGAEYEPEAFSPDTHWMPRLVLIAKSTLVWLDQLSKTYKKEIKTLDQIPDAELDRLAAQGFTGLWLIGIWERSPASKTIKNWCGNPEAEASAYSLYDYVIAQELGGDPAYGNLRERAWQRGIRLASDMVPNHTGIVSNWVKAHPDWFVSLPYPPFPAYTYSGASLSDDPNIGIFLEDHYFERTDAAVTFKRIDYRTGDTRYIYHGNDGTSMPWNDTAQLDYTNPAVREAVIQTILKVARRFPIIRFDAAMTLAKRHYQRLWFPQPGTGGDIPSRAQFGLTKAEFDQKIPEEFWREVVDRVAKEVPDTLLLAEAFWMMEGYFVRSLGMHRVYNSAFMNMLKNEENKKYRYTIKNTIEFEPEVLKRYVNFMNNPDEETAIHQFGDGDKYFGVCVMMATMPGLPMFGHGQVEGFSEKYGMEYRKAYYDESPNEYLVARHEREIFPLLKKRYLFAEVEHFLLYDLYDENGSVNENVFAYSNRSGEERVLVIFNNSFSETRGWIHTSAAILEKSPEYKDASDAQKRLIQKNLGDGLALPTGGDDFVIFRDSITNLEYIYNSQQLRHQGMYIELGTYKHRVLLDFRAVYDREGKYRELCDSLSGKGVASIEETLREIHLQPLHNAFRQFSQPAILEKLIAAATTETATPTDLLDDIENQYREFLREAGKISVSEQQNPDIAKTVRRDLDALLRFRPETLNERYSGESEKYAAFLEKLADTFANATATYGTLIHWIFVRHLGEFENLPKPELRSRILLDEWMLGKLVRKNLRNMDLSDTQSDQATALLKLLTRHPNPLKIKGATKIIAFENMDSLLKSGDFQQFCGVNEFENQLWFNKESFTVATDWLCVAKAFSLWQKIDQLADLPDTKNAKAAQKAAKKLPKRLAKLQKLRRHWQKASDNSQYLVNELIADLSKKARLKSAKDETEQKVVKTNAKSSETKAVIPVKDDKPAKRSKNIPPKQKELPETSTKADAELKKTANAAKKLPTKK